MQGKKLPERIYSFLTWSSNMSFFPETNTQFKCLDLGHSSSIIHSSLFSLPELKLKEPRMRRQDMTLVPADTCTSYKPSHFSGSLGEVFHLKPVDFEDTANERAPSLVIHRRAIRAINPPVYSLQQDRPSRLKHLNIHRIPFVTNLV